jgi:hypothetical protein
MVAVPYDWFDRFDWGEAFTKLICFVVLAVAAIVTRGALTSQSDEGRSERPALAGFMDMFLGIAMLVTVAIRYDIPADFLVTDSRYSDMGAVTYDAARRLFVEGENPYVGQRIDPFQPGYGYSYGPVTILGHFPAIISAEYGMKVANLILLGVCGILVATLAYRFSRGVRLERLGAALFALGLMAVPYRLWFELFIRCSSDLLEPVLFFLALLFVGSKRWFVTGLCVGLALASKMVFGVVAGATLVRRVTPWTFFFGVVVGLTPLALMYAADPTSFCDHYLFFQLVKDFDNTSLYSLTPPELHWLFPLARACALVACFFALVGKEVSVPRIALAGYLVLLVLCATHVEVHGNHLVWVMPMTALVMSWQRDGIMALLVGLTRLRPGS